MDPGGRAASQTLTLSELARPLLNELVECIATKRGTAVGGGKVQEHVNKFLSSLLKQKNVALGGAQRVDQIHPIAIRKSNLLRTVLREGTNSITHSVFMLWADSNR